MECDKHKRAVTGETSSAKITSFFSASRRKSDDAVLATEDVFVFHTGKHHSSNKTAVCASFYSKQYFLILKQTANLQACRQRQKQH
jgi:hypothetical protein